MIHQGYEDKFEATNDDLKRMHDLIDRIQRRQWKQEDDIKELNYLFHECLGTAIRKNWTEGD